MLKRIKNELTDSNFQELEEAKGTDIEDGTLRLELRGSATIAELMGPGKRILKVTLTVKGSITTS